MSERLNSKHLVDFGVRRSGALRRAAKKLQISVSELLRRIVDEYLRGEVSP